MKIRSCHILIINNKPIEYSTCWLSRNNCTVFQSFLKQLDIILLCWMHTMMIRVVIPTYRWKNILEAQQSHQFDIIFLFTIVWYFPCTGEVLLIKMGNKYQVTNIHSPEPYVWNFQIQVQLLLDTYFFMKFQIFTHWL